MAAKTDLKSLTAPLRPSYLYKSKDGTTGVIQCSTPIGPTVMKKWTSKRVKLGLNYLQPACEHNALLHLGSHPLFNTAVSFELDKAYAQSYYVHCGHDIQKWRHMLGPLPDADASLLTQHVGAQLLMAIDELHARGLVHRDVTPMNVLMRFTESGDFGDVLLGDFGLMCTAQEPAGFFTGYNYSYVLPEFIAYDSSTQLFCLNPDTTTICRYATTAADVFQAGWCLYELFTGSRPPGLEYVPAGDDPALLSSYLGAVALYDWQSAVNQHVRPRCQELADLLDLMLRTEPSHRVAPAVLLQQQYLAASHQAAVAGMSQRQELWEAEREVATASVDAVKVKLAVARLKQRGILHEPPFAEAAVQADAAAADTTASDAADSKQQRSLRKITVVSAARHSGDDLAPVTPPVAVSGEADDCESDHDDQEAETETESDDTGSSSSSTSGDECTTGDESETRSDDTSSSGSSSSSTSSDDLRDDDEIKTQSNNMSSGGSCSNSDSSSSSSSTVTTSIGNLAAATGSSSSGSLAASDIHGSGAVASHNSSNNSSLAECSSSKSLAASTSSSRHGSCAVLHVSSSLTADGTNGTLAAYNSSSSRDDSSTEAPVHDASACAVSSLPAQPVEPNKAEVGIQCEIGFVGAATSVAAASASCYLEVPSCTAPVPHTVQPCHKTAVSVWLMVARYFLMQQ